MKTVFITLFAGSAFLAGCAEVPAPPAAEEIIVLEAAPAPSMEEVLAIN